MRKIILLFLFATLTACGFHLRGAVTLSPSLHNLYLKTASPYSELARNLRTSLQMSGVHLTDTAESADRVLVILGEQESRQQLSISSTQQTSQYNLLLTVTFAVTTPSGTVLIPPQTLTETRTLTVNANQMPGSSNEAETLYQQIRQAIVFDIMTRLSSKNITKILNQRTHENITATT